MSRPNPYDRNLGITDWPSGTGPRDRDECGFCSGGEAVNPECPTHGRLGSAAIKDVLRRDALSRGPWALRILDEIERLEREETGLRGDIAAAEHHFELQKKRADALEATLAATRDQYNIEEAKRVAAEATVERLRVEVARLRGSEDSGAKGC